MSEQVPPAQAPPGPGLTGHATMTVGEADTAVALGSGDVNVLGTPRVVALAEEAACAALAGRLAPEDTSVGAHLAIDHLRPTAVGAQVVATATLATVEGRRLGFTYRVVEDPDGEAIEVARGEHRRVVLPRARVS